ncbi:MAG: hemolysin family protein [Vicinamibacterales bacterium]
MPIATELLVIVLLILANGVFAMSEMAVVAAKKVRLQQRAEDGDERAKAALELAQNPEQFLSTVQAGITLVGILAGAYAGATIAEALAGLIITSAPQVEPYARAIALGLVVAAITFLSLILGELVPKRIALNHPESIASWVAVPMTWLSKVGGPVVALLTNSTTLLLRLFGIKEQAASQLTEDEIKAVITQGAETGVIAPAEEDIVHRVLELGDTRVAAIMTPRPDIEWIDQDASPEELREFLASHPHTQFVVCQGGLDNVLGIVWSKDLLPFALRGTPINLKGLIREPLFVPDSMTAMKLLESFRSSHKHVALVTDEYGAIEGLVTVTDLLVALVGRLPVDASEATGGFITRADGSVLVDGSTAMEDVVARFAIDALPPEEAGAYHTMGGFVMARLGRVPKAADVFDWGGMRYEVIDMDGRRIDKVLVGKTPDRSTALGAGGKRHPPSLTQPDSSFGGTGTADGVRTAGGRPTDERGQEVERRQTPRPVQRV